MQLFDIQSFLDAILSILVIDLQAVEHSEYYWIFKLKQILLLIEFVEDGRIVVLDVENLKEHGGEVEPILLTHQKGSVAIGFRITAQRLQ